MDNKCDKCGSNMVKKGKIGGIASVQSLSSRTGIGGSELQLIFCANCGNVIEMKVINPSKIK